ncbi:MAG: hypothetical protein AB9903_34355 [Vulcanimicrobiota bacterium]
MKRACSQRYSCHIRNHIIARDLGVTEAEVKTLDLKTIVPERIARQRREATLHSKNQRKERREKVDEAIKSGLSNKEIMAMYNNVSRDYLFKRRQKLGVDLSGALKK